MSILHRLRHSLRWRLPGLVSLLIAAVLAVFLAASYLQVRATLLTAGGQRAQAAADQLVSLTSPSTHERIDELRRMAADPVLRNYLRQPTDQGRRAVEQLLRSLTTAGSQVAAVWSAAGASPVVLIAGSPEVGSALGVGAPARAAGLRLIETSAHLLVSEATEAIAPASSAGPSEVLGYLQVRRPASSSASADTLNRLVGGGARIEIGGSGGWMDLSRLVPAPPVDLGRRGVQEYVAADGRTRLGALAELPGTPWFVWVDFPRAAILAPATVFLQRMLIVAAAFVLLAAVVSRTVTSRITRPLAALTEASEAIAAGDDGRRVATERPDEIGRLGIAFNTMVVRARQLRERLEAQVREREQTVLALQESEAHYRAIVDVALDCIVTVDRHGRVVEFNPAAEATFGYRKSDILGQELADLIIPTGRREAHRHGVSRYFATGEGPPMGRLVELTVVGAGGREFPVEVAVQAVQIQGEPMLTSYMRDLTARRQAEAARLERVELEADNRRVREANRLKSAFLANMSHELRTPLNSIIGFSSLLHAGRIDPADERHHEFLGFILASGQHLLQVINDLLDLSKIEAGKLEFHPEPCELDRVIAEVLSVLQSATTTRHVVTTAAIDPAIRHVVIDPARLKQVLYNYLSNAFKFTPAGGTVDVRVTPDGSGMFRLEVADSGVGIAAADLGRLFQDFQQLDIGAAKAHAGTGLGLALTRRLVEAQGGTVGVRSVVGEGSVFHACLPRRHQIPAPPASPLVPEAARSTGPAVLVIEDDGLDRAEIVQALEGAGYAVEAVASGAAAVQRCRARAFDAITLDLLLPDMSGLDVLTELRASALRPHAPVIVVTIVAEARMLAGHAVFDILPKPVEAGAILASLRRAGVATRSPNRILVVDDDEGSAKLLAVSLEALGYAVEFQTDAREGLASAGASPPSAIILDLLMPRVDGFQFIDELRVQAVNRTTPIIVWTVKDLSGDEVRRLGAARSVLKKGHDNMTSLIKDLQTVMAPEPVGRE